MLSSAAAPIGGLSPARAMAVFMMARYVPAAPLAQSAERLHGKEKVYGSIP